MQEVLFSYIQFLILQISSHMLLFLAVLFGVPVFWFLMKLTGILDEDKALHLGYFVFCLCSVISLVLFFVNAADLMKYYLALVVLLAGVMTFLCVSPIFSESPHFEINRRKKYFSIDGSTFPVSVVNQVNVKRCFNRTERLCKMEIFISEEGSRSRTIYYETNDISKFREVVLWLSKYVKIEYNTAFTGATLGNPSLSIITGVVFFSIFIFCLLIPASVQLKAKRESMALPEYQLMSISKSLKDDLSQNTSLIEDSFKPIFKKSGIQIVVFDGAYSSQFVGNLKKALYSYSDQSYDFNIVFVTKNGFFLKSAFENKVPLSTGVQYPYTQFIMNNCNKFCLLDNELGLLYKTSIETIDPRINNVQDAVNILTYVSEKRLKEKERILAEKQAALKRLQEESD